MNMVRPSQALSRSRAVALLLLLLLHGKCKAQDAGEDALNDDAFTKLSPTQPPNNETSSPPIPTPPPTGSPIEYKPNSTSIKFSGHPRCLIVRDMYCINTTQEEFDAMSKMNSSEIESSISQTMVGELGFSFRPLIKGRVDYWTDFWSQNDTTRPNDSGLVGYSVTEESTDFEVRAYAMGVLVKEISNIDSVQGTFDATLRLYFFNITAGPFSTVTDAVNTIYKDDSKTTVKDQKYFRLHNDNIPGAWDKVETEDGERVHPDGICTASAMSTMKPIREEDFDIDILRLPRLKSKVIPTLVFDGEGYLRYVDVIGASFKTRPLNREFYPVQMDLLDIFFEMGSSDMIHEDQNLVKNLLCVHPSYTGFSNHVFGSDAEAGIETSNSLTMVPYMFFDRVEPWITADNDHFYYDLKRQGSRIGSGSELQRMIGLRIIVEQPTSKGFFELLPILFVSLAAVANFVSSDPINIGATSMVQALLGVNSLVTQNTQYIGQNTVMGRSLLLAYGINGIWISTVVLMMLINQAKGHEERGNKLYVVYQLKIFRYLRLLAASLCLLYVPFLFAYTIDKGNGNQESLEWAWALSGSFIAILFIVRVFRDYKLIKKKEKDRADNEIKALVFSSKPLKLWSQAEVVSWVHIGSMDRASYFSESKRSSIAEKLEAACVDGELLSEYGRNIDKLVQFVGLPFGDAVKLAKELDLLNNKASIRGVPSALTVYEGALSY